MSIMGSLGFSSTKGKSSSTSTTNSTVTPTNPWWVPYTMESLNQGIQAFGGTDPSQYVAPADALELLAAKGAGELGQDDRWYDSLMGGSAPPVVAGSLLDNLEAYQSPYTAEVVDAALADFDFNSGQTRASQDLELARSGAFGGSGASLAKSATEGELARGRVSTSANLRDQAFTRAGELSGADADRRQAASQANAANALRAMEMKAQLGLSKGASDREDIATQSSIGGILRSIEEARRTAGVNQLATSIGLFGQLPLDLLKGNTGTETTVGTGKTSSSTLSAKLSAGYGK